MPELARSIGLAKKEFDKAAKEASAGSESKDATSQSVSSTGSATGDPLIVAAKSLGISTEGKTKEEIAKDIAERSTKKSE